MQRYLEPIEAVLVSLCVCYLPESDADHDEYSRREEGSGRVAGV